jgi:hypothetical protein
VGDGTDSWGPVDRETWERRLARKARTKREDVFPAKTRPTRGLDGPAGTVSACGGGMTSGLAGPEAEWATKSAGPKSRKRISELKIRFFEFTKALEIGRRRFRRNFDMWIFPKFF